MHRYKVYAGNMFVGRLYVIPGISHTFIDCNLNYISSSHAISKVAGYKKLRLQRQS